jgi:hypothetical protein
VRSLHIIFIKRVRTFWHCKCAAPSLDSKRADIIIGDQIMLRKIVFTAMMLTVAGAASAQLACTTGGAPVTAPELDPSSLMAGLTLLAAGLALLRGRKKGATRE